MLRYRASQYDQCGRQCDHFVCQASNWLLICCQRQPNSLFTQGILPCQHGLILSCSVNTYRAVLREPKECWPRLLQFAVLARFGSDVLHRVTDLQACSLMHSSLENGMVQRRNIVSD